jgi:outer membrane protein
MKKPILILFALIVTAQFGFAQKFAYVDTEYILGKMPEYTSAQDEINRISEKWQADLEKKYAAIEQMYQSYTENEVIMPDDMKQERQDEIFKAEREAKEYREKKFGYSGELFQLQESKVQPLQDKVFNAVETIAKRKRVDMVFDKAGDVTWIYTNPIYDISNDVLEELGYRVD